MVPAIIKPQTDQDVAASAQTTFGEFIECLHIIPGISQIPQVTSRPGSSHRRLGSVKPQSDTGMPGLMPTVKAY